MKENLDMATFFDIFTEFGLNKMNKKIKIT